MIRIEVRAGAHAGQVFEVPGEVMRIGRADDAEIRLTDPSVAPEHARLVVGADGVLLEGLGADHGAARIRDGERTQVSDANGWRLALRVGDLVELGWGEQAAVLYFAAVGDAGEAHVMALRRDGEAGVVDPARLAEIVRQERAIGAASGLDEVLVAIADAALELVPGATHATLVLRDDDAFVPVLTRVRDASGRGTSPAGAVPVARAVFRKVVAERATVLAADAPRDVAGSQSLIGAQIKSIVGVPLFRGDELEGVLQVDNRSAPAMLGQVDVDVLAVLGTSASLAVANARLIERLRVAERELRRENTYLKGREAAQRGTRDIVGRGHAMRELLAQIDKVADTKVSVLIEGETGVGKELVASALHHRSRRRDKLFVTQNCAALPEQLLESELFGHKKGAFTGATEEKKGLFEIANGGTLFLDELGEMALSLQAKLLRALQEGEVRPVGATQAKHVDVRIVAATNRSLEAEVKAGRFREDLYYRLKVFPLRVPPLRERRDDVPLLAGHFLQRYAREIGKTTSGLAQATMEMLVAYDWPGNVRELQNEVQRLVIQVDAGGIVTPDLLSPHLRKAEGMATRAGVTKGNLREMMDTVERYLLVESLREHDNNKTAAARTLGITREGLHKKLRLLGLTQRATDGDDE
ncbi:MAG: sigma 54-interacting transcriptional regulator [Polyangiaceae bacterium]|nr:sigma 54-interacting transcriptional regulator [Polyangiaceae bacterium]